MQADESLRKTRHYQQNVPQYYDHVDTLVEQYYSLFEVLYNSSAHFVEHILKQNVKLVACITLCFILEQRLLRSCIACVADEIPHPEFSLLSIPLASAPLSSFSPSVETKTRNVPS